MKNYFLFFIFILCAFCADAQVEEDSLIIRTDSLPTRQEMLKRSRKDYGPWMISAGIGYGRLIAILPDSIDREMRKYFNSLLWGYTLKGSAFYYFKSGLGFGLQYHAFHSSAKLDSTNYTFLKGSRIRENISMQFIAPGIQFRLIRRNGSGYFNFGGGMGYFVYNDVARWETPNKVLDQIKLNGKSIGLLINASYNYRIDPHVSFGIGVGLNTGFLAGVKVNYRDSSYTDTTAAGPVPHFDVNAKLTFIF